MEVSEEFVNLALDLKSTYGNTTPRRDTLAKLLDAYRNNPTDLSEEVNEMFSEFEKGRGGTHIRWRD